MKLVLLLSGIMALSTAAKADSVDLWSVGHGFSQGGILGVQYQSVHDKDKATVALGLLGAAVGWQHAIDTERHHALGLSAGYEAIFADKGFVGATYNYYPSAGSAARRAYFCVFGGGPREAIHFFVYPLPQHTTNQKQSYCCIRNRFSVLN
ncbi:MAG: hypothetical protein U5L02_10950 [Rheinheimera sp.]|nr:hypothetical protein [Rheinheimera sp.]